MPKHVKPRTKSRMEIYQKRQELAVNLQKNGFSFREIGLILGMSHESARRMCE